MRRFIPNMRPSRFLSNYGSVDAPFDASTGDGWCSTGQIRGEFVTSTSGNKTYYCRWSGSGNNSQGTMRTNVRETVHGGDLGTERGKGDPNNWWNQGCNEMIGGDYIHPAELKSLQRRADAYTAAYNQIRLAECEYNAWLAGRFTTKAEVVSNCAERVALIPKTRMRCVKKNGKSKGFEKDVNWWQRYYSLQELDQLKSRAEELRADITYEKEQAQNLSTMREDKGITQRDLNILYPEAPAIVEELAPGSSVDQELGEYYTNGENGEGGYGSGKFTKNLVIAVVGILLLGGGAVYARKKLK